VFCQAAVDRSLEIDTAVDVTILVALATAKA